MNQYIYLVELSSTEVYNFVVVADSREEAESKVTTKYPNPPYMKYVGQATTFVE